MNETYTFKCPKEHYKIVNELLAGRFILQGEELFNIISNNQEYYDDFFMQSYQFGLTKTSEVIYLSSSSTSENFSKDLMLVLAVLVYEFNLHNKNIYEELRLNTSVEKISEIIKNSSYSKTCRSISLENLFTKCKKRNIIKSLNGNTLKFTNAINIFIEHAKKISEITD